MANVINATSTGSGGLVSTGDDSGILNIQTNETTAITVDASQNVGIGTASPATKLEVASPASTPVVLRLASNKTGTGAGDKGRLDFHSADNSGTAYQLGYMDCDRSDGTGTASYIAFANRVSGTVAERMRIISTGFFKASNTGNYQNVSQNYPEFSTDESGYYAFLVAVTNASYASDGLVTSFTARSASSTFDAQRGYTSGGNALYRIRGDGNQYTDGTYNNNGADYAEYFESANGQALTLGATVVLDGNKVREATDQDDAKNIIGVVRPKEPSKASMIVGNTAWNKWANQYLSDDFDRYIMEDHDVVEWTDSNGKKHSYESQSIPSSITVPSDATRKTHDENGAKFQHYKVNPDWNPDAEYVNRENRPEWNIIGLLGQVKLLKGKPVGDRWVKMRDVSDSVEEWFIR